MTVATFKYAVSKFKKSASEWLTDEDYPALQALEAMAEALDAKLSPSILSAYGVAYRALLARRPTGETVRDELEEALAEAERPSKAGPHAE